MSSQASGHKDVQADPAAVTYGPWVPMIEASSFPSNWMVVMVASDGTNSGSQFDIGVGGLGVEVAVIDDQQFHGRNQSGGSGRGNIYSFPMTLPQGTRISMRFKANETTTGPHRCTLQINNFIPSNNIPTVAQSSGAVVVSSGGLDAYGTWVELIASLNVPAVWLCMSVFGLRGNDRAEFDLGVGAVDLEVPVMKDLGWFKTLNDSGVAYSMGSYYPIEIAAGSRLAVRVKDDDATIRDYNCGVLAF